MEKKKTKWKKKDSEDAEVKKKRKKKDHEEGEEKKRGVGVAQFAGPGNEGGCWKI